MDFFNIRTGVLTVSAVLGAAACSPGAEPPDACTTCDVSDAGTEDTSTPNGGGWVTMVAPVYSGQYPLVGDPSVLRDETGTYAMYHHCIDVERTPQGGEICLVTSTDGLNWASAATPEGSALVEGRVLRASAATWHEAHETPFARRVNGLTSLFFIGYRSASFFGAPPSAIGMVESADGLSFSAIGASPSIASVETAPDAFGMTSPSVVRLDNGTLALYYTGWCAAPFDCPRGADPARLSLMAVTSVNGATWTRRAAVLVSDPGLGWTNGGISESEVVRGPDNRFYLFFSSLAGAAGSPFEVQRIGVAVADNPFGPFVFAPDPIVTWESTGAWANGGVLAPSVLFEGSRVRMWFHAFERDAAGMDVAIRIGYAEAAWPLKL